MKLLTLCCRRLTDSFCARTIFGLLALGTATSARAADFAWESVGVRGGPSLSRHNLVYSQAELFTRWTLPWEYDLGKEWSVATKLELSAGALGGRGDNGFVGSVGPVVSLKLGKLPLHLEGGVSPTYISRNSFGNVDFGIPFQFTSHGGLAWRFSEHWQAGYRFQHMSNAGFGRPNPGLNVQMFSLAYLF